MRRTSNDIYDDYIQSNVTVKKGNLLPTQEIYDDYCVWLSKRNKRAQPSQRELSYALKRYATKVKRGTIYWQDIELVKNL